MTNLILTGYIDAQRNEGKQRILSAYDLYRWSAEQLVVGIAKGLILLRAVNDRMLGRVHVLKEHIA